MTNATDKAQDLMPHELEHLGDGAIAYLKPIRSEDAPACFRRGRHSGRAFGFALLGADGSPILLTDLRDAAIANAWEHELETVSVH